MYPTLDEKSIENTGEIFLVAWTRRGVPGFFDVHLKNVRYFSGNLMAYIVMTGISYLHCKLFTWNLAKGLEVTLF